MATTEEGLRVKLGATVDALKQDIASAKSALSDLSKSVNQESAAVESANKSWNQMGKFILQVNYERRRMVQQINQGIGAWKLEAAAINEAVEAARRATGQFVKVSGTIRDVKSSQEAFFKAAKDGTLAYNRLGVEIGFAGKATKDWIEAYRRTGSTAAAIAQETAKVSKSMDVLRQRTTGAFGALSGFTNIIRDAPYGINGVGNNITQLSDAFVILKQQTGSTRAAFAALVGSIFSPAGLFSVGLSSAITLWTLYSQKQQKAASEAKKAADEFKPLSEIINDANVNLKQYTASALGEISVLNRLFLIASDETRSRKERTSALKELKQQTNGYLDSLTIETIKTDAARKSLDEFNKSLFNSAILKANQSYVEDLAKEWGKLARQGEEGKRRIAELDKQIRQLNQPGAEGLVGDERFEKVVALSKERNTLVLETNKAIKEQNRLQDEILSTGTKIAELQTKVNPFSKEENKDSTKEIKSISTVIRELQKDITGLNVAFAGTEGSISDLAIDKIKRYEKALKDLADFGVRPGDEVFNQIKSQIQLLQNSLSNTPVTIPIKVTIPPVPTITSSIMAQTAAAVRAGADTLGLELSKFNQQVTEILHSGTKDAVSSVSSAIGEAVVSGNAKQILGSFVGGISGLLEQLGKLLIAEGIGIEAFKTSLKSLQGTPAIIAGAAMVAAAAAFRAAIPSFATGGVVTGPQLAMVGDNPGRQEYIIPSEVLDKLGRGSGGEVVGRFELEGTKLVAVFQRSGYSISRVNG